MAEYTKLHKAFLQMCAHRGTIAKNLAIDALKPMRQKCKFIYCRLSSASVGTKWFYTILIYRATRCCGWRNWRWWTQRCYRVDQWKIGYSRTAIGGRAHGLGIAGQGFCCICKFVANNRHEVNIVFIKFARRSLSNRNYIVFFTHKFQIAYPTYRNRMQLFQGIAGSHFLL